MPMRDTRDLSAVPGDDETPDVPMSEWDEQDWLDWEADYEYDRHHEEN